MIALGDFFDELVTLENIPMKMVRPETVFENVNS
jgi:hypothetical protein